MKKHLTLIPLIFLISLISACQQGEFAAEETRAETGLTIIDVHVHAYPAWRGAEAAWFPRGLELPKTDEEVIDEMFDRFERLNIVKAVVFGPTLESWKQKSSDKIIPGWQSSIARNTQEDLDALRQSIKDGQTEVIGEILAQYAGLAPNDPALEPYYALAEEMDVPVGIHVGPGPPGSALGNSPLYRMRNGKPLLLEDVLVKHPKLRLYVMHAGWPFLDEMVALMSQYPHVYIDISASWLIPRDEFHFFLRRLVQTGFHKRIMFGSDQMYWPDAIELAIDTIESADFLTYAQKRDIFYNNAVEFFRLQ